MDNPFGPPKRKLRIDEPIKVYLDEKKEWRWRIRAGNGEIISASSEGFSSKQAAIKNFRLLAQKIIDYYDSQKD